MASLLHLCNQILSPVPTGMEYTAVDDWSMLGKAFHVQVMAGGRRFWRGIPQRREPAATSILNIDCSNDTALVNTVPAMSLSDMAGNFGSSQTLAIGAPFVLHAALARLMVIGGHVIFDYTAFQVDLQKDHVIVTCRLQHIEQPPGFCNQKLT